MLWKKHVFSSNGDVSTNGMTKLHLKYQTLKALLKLNMDGVVHIVDRNM